MLSMTWLTQNGLALYGAITGTAALLLTFFSYRHNVKKDQIKLTVSYVAHPQQAENIRTLNTIPTDAHENQPSVVEVYLVTVRNLGSIPAPLEDVGVMDITGKKYQVLAARRTTHMNLLEPLSKSDANQLDPRASKTFSVYLQRDEPMFSAVRAYAVDQTGKVWRTRT